MDHDLLNRGLWRDELKRDSQIKHELDAATPSLGAAGLAIGGIVLLILGIVIFGSPAGNDATQVATRDAIEAPAPTTTPTNP
jgi:hypothetical protein